MKLYREDMKELQKKVDNREELIVKLKDEISMHKEENQHLEWILNEASKEKESLVEENRKIMLGGLG